MLLVSLFEPRPDDDSARVAALWHGEAPPGIVVQRWIYLGEASDRVLLVWEAADDTERAWLEARMAPFGQLVTWTGNDATPGMTTAIERDFDAFAAVLRARGADETWIAAQLDVRRRGATAGSLEAAAQAGRDAAVSQRRD